MKKLKVIISAIGFLLLILAYLYFPSKLSKIYNSVETNAIVNLKIKPYQKPAELVELGDQSRVAYVTVVTTLFYFCKSKHSRNYYDKWLTNMIKSLGVQIFIVLSNQNKMPLYDYVSHLSPAFLFYVFSFQTIP